MVKIFKTFEIKQDDKTLSCDERLIIGNKFDNIITKLHFTFDEAVLSLGGNKYVALYNPERNDEFEILPMLPDDSILISSNITKDPGKWNMILLISCENLSHQDITPENAVYVSNELKCVVKDNFLYKINEDEIPMDANIKAWYLEALKLKGELDKFNNILDTKYKEAVSNGFEGTKEEWLKEHFETSNIMVDFSEVQEPQPDPENPQEENQFDMVEF